MYILRLCRQIRSLHKHMIVANDGNTVKAIWKGKISIYPERYTLPVFKCIMCHRHSVWKKEFLYREPDKNATLASASIPSFLLILLHIYLCHILDSNFPLNSLRSFSNSRTVKAAVHRDVAGTENTFLNEKCL